MGRSEDKERHGEKKKERKHHHSRSERKRKRYEDDDTSSKERHSKKHKTKKKHNNSKKEKKQSRKHDKQIKVKSRHKQPDESELYPLGDVRGQPPDTLLQASDYFLYHKHLQLFLFRQCGIIFDELPSSKDQHKWFQTFCEMYNSGKLEQAYYSSSALPKQALDECQKTRHRWNMKISDRDDKQLQLLQEGVHKQTEFQQRQQGHAQPSIKTTAAPQRPTIGPSRPDPSHPEQQEHQTAQDRYAQRIANRRLRVHVQTAEEEFSLGGGGKPPVGHERRLQQKVEIGQRTHGAARDKEAALELDDHTLFGDTSRANLEQQIQRSQQRTAKRQEQKQQRLLELQEKERAKQQRMMEVLGLTSDKLGGGKKRQIAPRKDG